MLKTVKQLCEESQWDPHTIAKYAGRADDPLPIRYVGDSKKYGRVVESEFEEWFIRNSTLYRDRKVKANDH